METWRPLTSGIGTKPKGFAIGKRNNWMACKPWSDSRKRENSAGLDGWSTQGRTPGQRSKMEMKLSSQDRTPLPTFLSGFGVWVALKNAWRQEESVGGKTVPGCGREQGRLGLGIAQWLLGHPWMLRWWRGTRDRLHRRTPVAPQLLGRTPWAGRGHLVELSLRGPSLRPEVPAVSNLPSTLSNNRGAVGLCLKTLPPTEPQALCSMEGTSVPCDKGQNWTD